MANKILKIIVVIKKQPLWVLDIDKKGYPHGIGSGYPGGTWGEDNEHRWEENVSYGQFWLGGNWTGGMWTDPVPLADFIVNIYIWKIDF